MLDGLLLFRFENQIPITFLEYTKSLGNALQVF
jgi:hypothetical protein